MEMDELIHNKYNYQSEEVLRLIQTLNNIMVK